MSVETSNERAPAPKFDIALIREAHDRIRQHIVYTPLLPAPMLDARLGCELLVKAESLQKTGSFKFRGALNMILQLPPDAIARGVVAFSSGNHGQAVAAAAALVGAPAVIVLPENAARVKVEACRWWGAEIVTYDQATQLREVVAEPYAIGRKMTLVPPFDDHRVMAGQGTAGIEICEQLRALGKSSDAIVACSSGGGLSSGVMTALRAEYPEVTCYVAEPFGYDKLNRSLMAGERVANAHEARTVMDALIGRMVGVATFPVHQALGTRSLAVTDDEALAGVGAAYRHLRLVVEAGGGAALGAVLAGKADFKGQTVVVVCSGGNIDPVQYSQLLSDGLAD